MSKFYLSTACDLILQFAALLILVMLIMQYARRKHHSFELSLFFQMCVYDLIMVIIFVIVDVVPLFFLLSDDPAVMDLFMVIGYWFIIFWTILRILTVSLLARWLLFVEYTLHRSRDIIRRRYKPAMNLFVVAAVLIIACIPIEFWSSAKGGEISPTLTAILITLYVVSHAIFLFYVIAACVLVYREKQRSRIPAYIRLAPTTLCLIMGVAADTIITLIDVAFLPLLFALGLLFADYYMYRRLNNIDPKTGFFNKKYIPALMHYAKKNTLSGATIISLRTENNEDGLAALLKIWAPENCKTVTMGDGRFLLISEPVKDSVAECFIGFLEQQIEGNGILLTAEYETHREESLDQLLNKYA